MKNDYLTAPFPIAGHHSDNGSGFISHDTIDWRDLAETLLLPRSRTSRKNDNCCAGRKNNAFVGNYAGYRWYDSGDELAALKCICESLCPLLNFFMPDRKLISKATPGSKTIKRYDKPETPYQRLMESPISEDKVRLLHAEGSCTIR